MKISGGTAAFAGAIVVLCAVVAWAWYARTHAPTAPQPVQQIAAGSPTPAPARSLTPSSTPAPTATPSPGPVVYVPQPQPVSPSPASHAPPAARGTPSPTPAPFVPGAGRLAATQEPMVAATLAPHLAEVKPIAEPANAPPRILSMSMSTPVAHAGEVVSGTVETSSNVASVEARIAGYSSSMRKVGVGRFTMSYRVPNLPFFLHRTYTIEVIARNTRGDAVRTSVPITIR